MKDSDLVVLRTFENVVATNLGDLKLSRDVKMLLEQDPQVLLVDEPVAGMTHAEMERTAVLLRNLAGKRTIVIVEHVMEFVRSIARRVTVLHEGRVLADGPMAQIQADPRVVEVYLGE